MSSPGSLRLVFAEPVELTFTRVELIGPTGATVMLGDGSHGESGATELIVEVGERLQPGMYVVRWQTTSADGHPVRGEFGFEIEESAAAGVEEQTTSTDSPALTADTSEREPTPAASVAGEAFDAESPLYVAARWLGYLGLMTMVGAIAFAMLVVGLSARQAGGAGELIATGARRTAASAGIAASLLFIAAAAARLIAQSAAIFGTDRLLDGSRLRAIVLESGWGMGWSMSVAGALVILIALTFARGGRGVGWYAAIAALPLLLIGQALGGHAAAVEPPLRTAAIAADALHLLGAGGWIGTLLVLLMAGLPAANRLGSARQGGAVSDLVRAFSPIALVFAGLLIASGVFAAALQLGSFSALTGTTYGRTLLVKLALIVPLLGFGAWNFLAVRPTLGSEQGISRLRRSAASEVGIALLVLLVTAVLVATPSP